MSIVTTIDVKDMTPAEYRAVLDRMGVETRPEPGIYLHITVDTDFGYRVIEIWDKQESFEAFAERRMFPSVAGPRHRSRSSRHYPPAPQPLRTPYR